MAVMALGCVANVPANHPPAPISHTNVPSHICFPHSHPIGLMSSLIPHPDVSLSQFQDLFDAALWEYNQKTGKDITTDPLTARLLCCDTSDAVLGILQEQAHAFNQYRNGDWKVQLMRRLKPTVDILFGLSTGGVFGEGIGLVRLTKSIFALRKFIILHLAETSTIESNICRSRSPTRGMYLCLLACLRY
jgi:hypothetical protein